MVGLERSVLPLVGKQDFGLTLDRGDPRLRASPSAPRRRSPTSPPASLAERLGRKRLLVVGWLVALPVPLLIGLAPSWWFIVAANLLLGVNQGLAWSMTVVMKIDLAGPRRRGLALGLNEAAGYLGVAATAFATGALAASYAPRTVVWVGAALIASRRPARQRRSPCATPAPQVALEQRDARRRARAPRAFAAPSCTASLRDPVLRACSQAGLVNNLNDALAWGLAPLYLAAHGAERPPDRDRRRRLPARLGRRPARHRLALRPHRPQAADRRRHARPGRRARPARRRRRRLRALARRRGRCSASARRWSTRP